MYDPNSRGVKSTKSRLTTINQNEDSESRNLYSGNLSKVHSHFLVPSEKLDKVTRRVIAPYAQIERKGLKEEEAKEGRYLDMNRFNVFLEDTVDLDSLLYETAMVLKTVTNSSGVFVYIVDPVKNEIVLMPHNTKMPERHEVNIPIEEGKVAAAHVAFTKEFLLLPDVQRDRRFAEGLKWVDAKVALCMPVIKPDGHCYAVLELYRTYSDPYTDAVVYTVVSVACWAGAAVHQAQARITLQKTGHLNNELRSLLQSYFCDLASIDTMLTDMLAVVKSFMGAMRSSFFIVDKDHVGEHLQADMWDDGWAAEKTTMPKKKVKINLSQEQTPAGLVARTGKALNVRDAYKDPRFSKEIDPTTGTVVRSCLVSPIMDKHGVIGVVQLTNKTNTQPFNEQDEMIFNVFVSYCSLIVHFYNMQQKKIYHLRLPYQRGQQGGDGGAGVLYVHGDLRRPQLREEPAGRLRFDYTKTVALMLSGLCHDLDHPGYNNNFLALCKHPLAHMYKSSMLEYHHYFLAKKIIEDKNILAKLPAIDRERIMEEIKYDILCTDLAVYFQIRAQLTPLVADHSFDWGDNSHRRMLKGILMTTSDLSGCCKPFGVAKSIAESVYEEFYNQGDKERAMGYTPLSMMDRRRSVNQPAEQIQFLSVVVLPCLLLLQNIFPSTGPLTDKCRKTQEAWREEIEIRGQKLWRQDDSVAGNRSRFYIKSKSEDLS